MDFKKNDIVTVEISDMGSEGEGIGKAQDFTLFVKDAVPGDVVEARILKPKKNYAYAKAERILKPSPFRVAPPCSYHRQCGGCQLQALSYEKQLQFKQEKIKNSLIHIGGFDREWVDQCMEPIVGMETPLRYRNKAQYPVGTDREGNLVTGFYAGRTHSIIANRDCLLGGAENEQVLDCVLKYMERNHVSAYDEKTGRGLIRHILIRKGFSSGEIMVCLVVNQKMAHVPMQLLPRQEELVRGLTKIKGMTSVSVSINTERTNVVMGKKICTIWGRDTISDSIRVRDMQALGFPFAGKELTFQISPLSFYQVNPVQTEKLYSLALEYAGLTGKETVWDLYCGIGTISLFLAGNAKKVYGIEIIPEAIRDARENARLNGIRNAEFFVGGAEDVLRVFGGSLGKDSRLDEAADSRMDEASDSRMDKAADRIKLGGQGIPTPDVVVVDPPRKGCDASCLEAILAMHPERIVYVSCDPATLARDLRVLCSGGYEIRRVRGVDQFGMTVHVEVACCLQRKDS